MREHGLQSYKRRRFSVTYVPIDEGWLNVHHSDRGSQYAANEYRKKLKARALLSAFGV